MSYLTAYLFTRLDGIFITLKLIAIVSSSLAFTGFLGYILSKLNDEDVNAKKFKKHTKPFLIIAVITTLMALVTPTQKEIAFIYIAPKIANNTELKEAANRVPHIINHIDKLCLFDPAYCEFLEFGLFEDDEIQIENGEKARSTLSKIDEVMK